MTASSSIAGPDDTTPTVTAIGLGVTLNVSTAGARVALQELVARGQVEIIDRRIGPGGGTSYRVGR